VFSRKSDDLTAPGRGVRSTRGRRALRIPPLFVLEEEWLKPLEMTQTALADKIGVHIQVVNGIIQGRRAVTAKTALLMGRSGPTRRRPCALCSAPLALAEDLLHPTHVAARFRATVWRTSRQTDRRKLIEKP
jgi:addiction module HigA family antidote